MGGKKSRRRVLTLVRSDSSESEEAAGGPGRHVARHGRRRSVAEIEASVGPPTLRPAPPPREELVRHLRAQEIAKFRTAQERNPQWIWLRNLAHWCGTRD